MKRINTFLTVIFLMVLMPLSLWGLSMEDYAGILTDDALEQLEIKAQELEETYDMGIYVAILPDKYFIGCEDLSIEELSELWYGSFELGVGPDYDGILLIMDMDERDYDICAHGDRANYAFTDYGKTKLSDAFAHDFSENDWYDGFVCYLKQLEKELVWAEKGSPVDYGSESEKLRETLGTPGIVGIALLIGLVIALCVCCYYRSKMRSVRPASSASAFVSGNGLVYTEVKDKYLMTTETVTVIESKSSGGTSTNSGGYSHSSGKF